MRHLESNLQMTCIRWFALQYVEFKELLYAIPNGGKRNLKEAIRLKKEGVVAGVSDLCLAIPKSGYSALYVELKTEKGRLTDNQKHWQTKATEVGNKCITVRSFEQFQTEVESYLKYK